MCEVGGGRSGQKEDSRLELGARGCRVGRVVGIWVADSCSGFRVRDCLAIDVGEGKGKGPSDHGGVAIRDGGR